MKKLIVCTLAATAMLTTVRAEDPGDFATEVHRVSYALGLDMGQGITRMDMDIDLDMFLQGARDALEGADTRLSDSEKRAILTEFQREFAMKQRERMLAQAESNKAEGDMFLAENAEKEGITTTESGLQYEVLEEGDGESPTLSNSVVAHYEGRLIDGTVFDSSIERGEPATFPLRGVIKGWTEGLQLMKTGAKFRFYIPSDLGYGARGAPPKIGPHAVLIFDVELLEIK